MKAGLYIVPTPIGNMDDITIRAINTLKGSDLILCEDTRVTKPLLQKYDIIAKLSVYNDYSDNNTRLKILNRIKEGKIISLVSDAGTPLIADPGYKLIDFLRAEGVHVDVLPGACSVISALCLSGMPTDQFMFLGFMPRKLAAQESLLKEIAISSATCIFFENPKRIVETLNMINQVLGTRICAIVREISKIYQEVLKGSCLELMKLLKTKEIKGEVVLLLQSEDSVIPDMQIINHLKLLISNGISKSKSAEIIATLLNLPKNRIYEFTKNM